MRGEDGDGALQQAPVREAFVGREAPLAQLEAALVASRTEPRVVLLGGVSGMGKSALASRFASGLDDEAVVLRGRCHERDSLPFKGLDGALDQLVQWLLALEPSVRADVLGGALGVVPRVFPVFQLLADGQDVPPAGDPATVRDRAFEEIRALLVRLAAWRPVVLVLDDLQWADRDAAQALRGILREPAAPHVLVVGTYRTNEAHRSPVLPIFDAPDVVSAIHVEVAPLTVGEVEALASLLVPGMPWATAELATLHAESGGNPFVVEQALRFGRREDGHLTGRVDDVLRARVEDLSASDRALLTVAAVAGHALTRDALWRVARHEADGDLAHGLVALQNARLLTSDGAGHVETYHDRIREAVVPTVPPDRRARIHLVLADDLVE
ncbi:MAG: AAA family ATPase, partial [Myxococcales bacterium]|nr:AAA family ATPase [Myxococcales bacterium]